MRIALVLALVPALAAAQSLESVDTSSLRMPPRPAPSAASQAGGGGTQGKRLDLSGLLGPGQAVPGPSAGPAARDPDEASAREAVLAAVAEYAGPSAGAAREAFAKVIERANMEGTSTGPSEQDFRQAADLIGRMIRANPPVVKIKLTGGRDFSGAWSPDPYEGPTWVTGTFEIPSPSVVKTYGRSDRSFSHRKDADLWANTILHETAHLYHTIFTSRMGFREKKYDGETPACFGARYVWTGESPYSYCQGESCPFGSNATFMGKPCYQACPQGRENLGRCYMWNLGLRHSAGGTEKSARELSLDVAERTQGQAYARVLEKIGLR